MLSFLFVVEQSWFDPENFAALCCLGKREAPEFEDDTVTFSEKGTFGPLQFEERAEGDTVALGQDRYLGFSNDPTPPVLNAAVECLGKPIRIT